MISSWELWVKYCIFKRRSVGVCVDDVCVCHFTIYKIRVVAFHFHYKIMYLVKE